MALLVATHLALCPGCRRAVAVFEAVAGELLDRLAPAPLGGSCLAQALALLDHADALSPPPPRAAGRTLALLPRPLRDYVPDIEAVGWRSASPGFDVAEIAHGGHGPRARLMRLRGGFTVPAHRHRGREVLLVLEGALAERMRYARGDVVVAETDSAHQPKAESGPTCLCLAVLDGPWQVRDPGGRPALMFE